MVDWATSCLGLHKPTDAKAQYGQPTFRIPQGLRPAPVPYAIPPFGELMVPVGTRTGLLPWGSPRPMGIGSQGATDSFA
jgi:hypothetical protein